MNYIEVPVAPDLREFLTGEIARCDDVRKLSQDMAEVSLPNGVIVHAGWYGSAAKGGCYRIYVQHELEHLVPVIELDEPEVVAKELAALAAEYRDYRPTKASNAEVSK